ncbi:hypothetical protein D9757_006632 [Collybiopsis confluens]|uniref:Zn(2)-C6 fungal-type domain-containing protein n=1 Tax=Collybiopsis confluens TaxID=2823264 RepID=A0A8H5MAF1_9AGAR|nr:hypothetical protein D9757_006632 [Collybiopsis confluens]
MAQQPKKKCRSKDDAAQIPPESGSKPIQKLQRRRALRACDSCRRQKIKCDGCEPTCSQWTKDRAALDKHYVRELEAKLLRLECLNSYVLHRGVENDRGSSAEILHDTKIPPLKEDPQVPDVTLFALYQALKKSSSWKDGGNGYRDIFCPALPTKDSSFEREDSGKTESARLEFRAWARSWAMKPFDANLFEVDCRKFGLYDRYVITCAPRYVSANVVRQDAKSLGSNVDGVQGNRINFFQGSEKFSINGGEFNAIGGDMHNTTTNNDSSSTHISFNGCTSDYPSSSPPPPPPKRRSRWSTTTFIPIVYHHYIQPDGLALLIRRFHRIIGQVGYTHVITGRRILAPSRGSKRLNSYSTTRVTRDDACPHSPDTVVRASLFDIQHKANANEGESIEDVPAACVAAGEDEIDEIVVDRSWRPSGKDIIGVQVCSSLPEKILAPSNYRSRVEVQIRKMYILFRRLFQSTFPGQAQGGAVPAGALGTQQTISVTLGAAMIPTPAVLADKIYYYAFAPCSKNAQNFACFFSLSRNLSCCPSGLPFFRLGHGTVTCHSIKYYSDFFADIPAFSTFSLAVPRISPPPSSNYTTALQTVALFDLELKRFPALLGSIIFIVLAAVFIAPEKANWMRNVMNFVVFQIFLMYMHYQREMSARHLFELRIELKEQFERTQQAQLNERKTADSKYRLTSYVFHDEFAPSSFPWCLLTCIAQVRVPLNTALLALQNMSATGSIAKSLELEFNALEGSLNMMSKVLNDVLDFNRLDSGKLESLSKPYAFHQVMRSMFLPLRLATDARKLELIIDLDMNIDEVARRGAYRALGKESESIETLLKEEFFSIFPRHYEEGCSRLDVSMVGSGKSFQL